MQPIEVKIKHDFIKQRRRELGMTPTMVCEKIEKIRGKMSLSYYITKVEAEQTGHMLGADIIYSLSVVLQCNLDDLYSATPAPKEFPLSPAQQKIEDKKQRTLRKKELAEELKQIRVSKKIPTKHIAEKLGKSQSYVHLIEKGVSSIDLMEQYAKIIGCPLTSDQIDSFK
jgi:DNA-binding transcriptional regulator YiaG